MCLSHVENRGRIEVNAFTRANRGVCSQCTTGANGKGPCMERLLYSIADAGAALGIGRSKVYELMGEGKITTVRIGRRRLIQGESIRALALGEAA